MLNSQKIFGEQNYIFRNRTIEHHNIRYHIYETEYDFFILPSKIAENGEHSDLWSHAIPVLDEKFFEEVVEKKEEGFSETFANWFACAKLTKTLNLAKY